MHTPLLAQFSVDVDSGEPFIKPCVGVASSAGISGRARR